MKRLVFCSVLLAGWFSQAAYTNATLNIAACGGTLSGGGYVSTGSLVPVGGGEMQSGSLYHQSGFAADFILQPGTAFSGLPDELNPDNDRDGLQDGEEIAAGSNLYKSDTDSDGLSDPDEIHMHKTSPLLADSDADGMDDFHELIAGTSATNRNSVLSVVCTLLPDGRKKLSWLGVQGRSYTFQYTDSLAEGNWQSYPLEITGGDSTVSLTDTEPAPNRFYRVQVRMTE
jgi:hypothetical protein